MDAAHGSLTQLGSWRAHKTSVHTSHPTTPSKIVGAKKKGPPESRPPVVRTCPTSGRIGARMIRSPLQKRVFAFAFLASFAANSAYAKGTGLAGLDAIYPELDALYIDLHQNPELSGQESKTAAKLADRLRRLGYEVTTGVGGHGIVALMRNGDGPTLMLRTDMDALPVEEKTGVPYASKVTAPGPGGTMVPVMHACGHDVHMSSLIGAATLLTKMKDRWKGTLILIGQPAEETLSGAEAMIKDGLFTRFPKPAYAVAIHDTSFLPAGTVGYTPGFTLSNLNTVSITIRSEEHTSELQ